ncbi:FimB/Mfa2 family fimbrial subunit, partial [uncultured Duncaniella sp.]
IPLVNYLLMLKSQEFADMESQEFLDRESRWKMVFFLDEGNTWINTQIVINDWVVRINDTEL